MPEPPATRRARSIAVLFAALALLAGARETHASALERAGNAVQHNNDPPRERRRGNDCDDESFLGALLGGFFEAIFTRESSQSNCAEVGYELQPQRLGEPYSVTQAEFIAYPYENGQPGNMTDCGEIPVRSRESTKRLWIEYGTDYDDIDLLSTGFIWESVSRWGIDASVRTYFENLGPAGNDDLTIGDIGAFYRLLQGTNASMRLGLAVPWVAYDSDLDAGLSFTLGSEYFPLRPWIISTEADLGFVGHASLVHLRGTLGFQIRHAELYTGVDYLSLDGQDLTAMVFGVRGWW